MTPQAKEKVTAEFIHRLAEVAGLTLGPERREALLARYLGFLGEMEQLQELDIEKQEPASIFLAGRRPSRRGRWPIGAYRSAPGRGEGKP